MVASSSHSDFLINPYDHIGFFYIPGASLTDNLPVEIVQRTNPHWKQFPPQSQLLQVTLYFCYSVVSLTSVATNVICLARVLQRYRKLDILLLNLTLSDLTSSLVRYPLVLVNIFDNTTSNCDVYGATTEACSLISFFTFFIIGFQRYCYAVKKVTISKFKLLVLVIAIWGCSITISFIPIQNIWIKYSPDALLTTCSFDYLSETETSIYFTLAILTAYATASGLFVIFYCVITFRAIFLKKTEIQLEDERLNIFSFSISLIFAIPYLTIKGNRFIGGRKYITPLLTFAALTLNIIPSCVIPVLNMKFHKIFQS